MHFVSIVVSVVGWLAVFVGGIMFLVVGFRAGVLWGLAMLFLSPLAQLAFLFTNWEEARRPFFTQLAGMLLFLAGIGIAFGAGAGNILSLIPARTFESLPVSAPLVREWANMEPIAEVEEKIPLTASDSFIGRTLVEVKSVLGDPKGMIKTENGVTYLYPKLEVFSSDGVHVKSQGTR